MYVSMCMIRRLSRRFVSPEVFNVFPDASKGRFQVFCDCLPVKASLQSFPSLSLIFFQLPSSLPRLSSSSLTEMISDTDTLCDTPASTHTHVRTQLVSFRVHLSYRRCFGASEPQASSVMWYLKEEWTWTNNWVRSVLGFLKWSETRCANTFSFRSPWRPHYERISRLT